jgi:preprotein translocase subunit SecY
VGAQIPGVSRGAPTQRYLTRVLSRITLPGALFLGLVAALPWVVSKLIPQFGSTSSSSFFLISSAGLLIVVGVVRDTFFNIQAELKLHGYDDALLIK